MRVLGVLFVILSMTACVTSAQAPAREPVGSLALVMRSILFPNSNILFDTQSRDPDAPPETRDDGTVSATFSSIYTGWGLVEAASVALAESAHLIVMPGRMCENGRPVPVGDADFQQFASDLVDVGRKAYEIAKTKNLDAMVEVTNEVAGACENCHTVYRKYEDRCTQ